MSVDIGAMASDRVNRNLSLGGILQYSGFVLLSNLTQQEEVRFKT